MATSKPKAQYAKPASQLDLEERQEKGNASDRVLSTADSYEASADEQDGRDYRVEGNDTDSYIGVSPEYMTYANETEAPIAAEDSAEEKVADHYVENYNTQPVKPAAKDEDDDEEEDEPTSSDSTDSTSAPTS